jgi:hypothetical protein
VCARIKSSGGGGLVAQDRARTSDCLLHVLQNLVGVVPGDDQTYGNHHVAAVQQSIWHPYVRLKVLEFMEACKFTSFLFCVPQSFYS